MGKSNLFEKCHINTNVDGDTFVGIQVRDGDISIRFPLGYRLEEDEKNIRKDIINLISILKRFDDNKNKVLPHDTGISNEPVEFPLLAYMRIILNYLNNGYYYESDIRYTVAKKGKINWGRTIKTQKTFPQGNDVFYLNFVVKDNTLKKDELVTLIHEYCVYESFVKLGWLYTTTVPNKPRIKFDKKLFLSVLFEKMGQTYNDKNRSLFQSMIELINSKGNEGNQSRFYYGTNRFEYVWERMIDYVFGVDDKERYFPRTTWHLVSEKNKDNKALEPDTIMVKESKVFVLDAKYYKYGATGAPAHLPESSSINKQITYGEYIATNESFKIEYGEDLQVYNSFLMPFSKNGIYFATDSNYKYIGKATGDWKQTGALYEQVAGILLDVKSIMYNIIKRDKDQITKLSDEIEKHISGNNA